MVISYLGQGFEPESINAVGNKLKNLLADSQYDTFFCISAFASASAVDILGQIIKDNPRPLKNYTIIVGIDEGGTPKDALVKLLNLRINSYIFHQNESPTFHPKIYIFEGIEKVALIIGSSNLTGKGLFSNVESSIMVEFSRNEEEGITLLYQVKEYFSTLFDFSDPNLFELSENVIDYFVNQSIIPQKSLRSKQSNPIMDADKENDNELFVPKRRTAHIPYVFKGKYRNDKGVSEYLNEIEYTPNIDFTHDVEYKCLWSCSNLTRRDLNIPTGTNTNVTGSMLLKKGNSDINPRRYFYEEVFSALTWRNNTRRGYEYILLADCTFRMVIEGRDYGNYKLTISYNPLDNTATTQQANSNTSLRWGEAISLINHEELLGKSLFLLKNINSGEFVIEIK